MDTVNAPTDQDTRPLSVESNESEVDIEFGVDVRDEKPPSTADEQDDVTNDDLLEEEAFMTLTQEEQSAWEDMIQKLKHELEQHGQDFSQWSDKITRRRMYAYARMKKLEKYHQTRQGFYRNIDGFIETFHGDVLNSDDKRDAAVDKRDTQVQSGGGGERDDKDGADVSLTKELTTPVITKEPPATVAARLTI
ncbi:uncharacterized protein LOC124149758 [Haliotis rufescens]|uniref:uncharacterized protein LOC124149758 n=1 Tax=Haliotis rufescens TaxID=6454 RepID=UPI00201F1789|nr:uncharacterized protein LOC124149758 [Haliotis rufescens]XP_046377489.2 uncharacterized protein LOC124149758 [Haliotis rufescens]XP_046377490.2 uncharacterized protein LOC124149758 [Haliotis rufescens]XP_048242185.1 uncharacterized protein LOC124149758 [Haliotis rufescens]